jgi:hypothetical protein
MKTLIKTSILAITLFLMLIADIPLLSVSLVPDAEAIFGVRRRAWRRGAVVGATAGAAAARWHQPTVVYQDSAPAAATAPPPAAHPAPPPAAATAPPPAAAGKRLPLGTVVHALPEGCTATPVGGEQYYYCGGNFYRAVFQGNSLVYVTAQPK